jgi:hypothetical protein
MREHRRRLREATELGEPPPPPRPVPAADGPPVPLPLPLVPEPLRRFDSRRWAPDCLPAAGPGVRHHHLALLAWRPARRSWAGCVAWGPVDHPRVGLDRAQRRAVLGGDD